VRIEVFAAEDDVGPADLLKRWERALSATDKRKSNYLRVGSTTEYKLSSLPAARIVYTVRNQNTNGEFEINVVRRDDILFAVTAACVNDSFERRVQSDELREALQSFELILPKKSTAPTDAESAGSSIEK
jgi:hypothetical protein